MARVEKVKNNLFDFDIDDVLSFETENYVGEWIECENGYVIFNKMESQYAGEANDIIHSDDLEMLVNDVKEELGEDILKVYDKRIVSININI